MGDVIQLDPVYPGEDDEQEARRRALRRAAYSDEQIDAEIAAARARPPLQDEARRRALEAMRAQIAADTPEALDAEEPGIRAEAMARMPPPPQDEGPPVQQLPEQTVTAGEPRPVMFSHGPDQYEESRAPSPWAPDGYGPPRAAPPTRTIAAMGQALAARRGDPNVETYGMATDADPVLPGRISPENHTAGSPTNNSETFGTATDADPVLPGRVEPRNRGGNPDAEIYGMASDTDPVLPGRARGGATGGPSPKTGGTPSDRDWETKAAKAAQGEWEQAQALTNDNRRRKAIIAALGAVLGASPASVQAALQGGDEPMQLLMAKRRDDADRRSARSAQERSRTDRAENERRAGLEERRVSLAESEAARRGERDDAQAERLGRLDESRIQLETIRADAARGTAEAQAQMRDPQSAASQAARDLVTQQASNPRLGLNVDPEQLAGMSAQQIEEVYGLGNLGTGWQNVRRGVGRAGRGGAGGPNVRNTRQRAAMVSDLRRAGYSDEQIASQLEQMGIEAPAGQMDPYRMSEAVGRMQRAGYTQEEIQQELGASAPSGGMELLPGVRAGIDVGNSEPEKFRTAFADMRVQYAALDRMQALSNRYGANAVVSPQARAEISAELPALRAMVAQLQNSGIINPGEAPLINATLPNPSDLQQMTFGEVGIRSGSFKRQLEASVRAGLEARGVDEAGITRAMAGLRGSGFSGGGARPTGPAPRRTQGETITVRSPNGTQRDVPRGWYENLDERRRSALQVVE